MRGQGQTVSVVVVSFNTRDATVRAARSALEGTRENTLEVIVVDNGSIDGSADALEREVPAAVVHRAGENLGFARAVNRGVEMASGTFVLLLNPDTVVLDGAIDEIVRFATSHPRYGVYGGRTIRSTGELDPSSCWGRPTLWSVFCTATTLSTLFRHSIVFNPEALGTWQRDTVREVAIVTGCLLLVRRRDFLHIGGMDETFFLYGEDAEFCLRARRYGFAPVIVPTATIVHDSGGSTNGSGRKMSMVYAGKITLFRTIWPARQAEVAKMLLLIGVAVRALLERATRRRRRMWTEVWQRRRSWVAGYPAATVSLFPTALDPRTKS